MKPQRVAVALSGGRDSTALLAAALNAARPLGIEVVALHVHHGLSRHADAWLAHCERLCAELAVPLAHRRLEGQPGRGASVEAWARRERYRALAEMARQHAATLVLLAHHRRDQAETVLLQALRGAGPAGLAAMPRYVERDGLGWARPWLEMPRERVEAYAASQRLRWVDDDSNDDTRYARNRLRHAVWPALVQAWPDAESALVHAARQAQAALACLREVAQADLATCVRDDGALDLARWRALEPGRRDNALRAWLRRMVGRGAPQTLVDRLGTELAHARSGRWPLEGGELRCYRGALRRAASAAPPASPALPAVDDEPASPVSAKREQLLAIKRAGRYRLPGWQGTLEVRRVASGGIALARLAALELRERGGGEQFQLAPRSAARSLKKQYQALAIPAWQRDGPLLYDADGCLLFAPHLGLDARALAGPGDAQVSLLWEPLAAPG